MKPLYIKQGTKIYIPDGLNTKQEKVSALQIARCYGLERYPFLILGVEKMQGRDTFNTIILEIQENYPEIIFY